MDRDKYKEMDETLGEAWTAWDPWMREAKTDLKYLLGDQWSDSDKAYLDSQARPHLVLNDLRRFHNLLTGYQRQNRLDVTFKPVEASDATTAEQFTELIRLLFEAQGGFHQEARQFASAIKTGLDWMNIYVDFNDDWEAGDVRLRRTAWTKIIPDPMFQELDLSDCSYLFRREPLSEKQIKLMLPNIKLADLKENDGAGAYRIVLDPAELTRLKNKRYYLTEFWRKAWKPKTFLFDIQSGERKEFSLPKGNTMQEQRLGLILKQFPNLRVVEKRGLVTEMELYIGEDLVWSGDDPFGAGDFPYVPMFAYFDPEYDDLKWKLQGIIRSLRDPQTEKNKRRSQLLHIINTMATSGWIWEKDSMDDETQMNNASGAGVQIRMKQGKIGAITPIQSNNFPAAIVQVEEMFSQDSQNISGINAELMAQMEKDVPGIAIQLRQRQGLIMLQELFDNYRLSKKLLGRLFINIAQKNYTPNKVGRLLNQPPAPAFYSKGFGKYDVVIDESVTSPTQKEYNFHKIMWYHQNVGPVHPMILLELADLPEKYRNMQAQFMLAAMNAPQPPQGGGGQPGGKKAAPPDPSKMRSQGGAPMVLGA